MNNGEQTEVIAFLSDAATYGKTVDIETMETHISMVFLAGDRAFKLKRAVKYPYIDASTAEIRLVLCEKEVRLNHRTAPQLYIGIRRITREKDGTLVFDGSGALVDTVVEMRRFEQENLFDRLALADRLTPRLMDETATMIRNFHESAEVVHEGSGSANMAGVLAINEGGFASSTVFPHDEITALTSAFRIALEGHKAALDLREAHGKVRLCHGDLHLRNIFLLEEKPLLFDCIDFNDRIATVDVLYDLAFLLMDLWHRGHRSDASLVMNRYLDLTGDEAGFSLLPFFMAVRAEVRAHVTATQAGSADQSPPLAASARSYFDLATRLLVTPAPELMAIGGFSGSGKSTISASLAADLGLPPGARILESDRIRKSLFEIPVHERLPLEAYRPEISQQVYATLFERAEIILKSGGTVIVNAVFDRPAERERIEAVAADAGVPFTGLWLGADDAVLRARVGQREQGASDATVDVLDHQLERGTGPLTWHRIDAARPASHIVAQILAEARSCGEDNL